MIKYVYIYTHTEETMKKSIKQNYETPEASVFEVKIQGIVCQSKNTMEKPKDYEQGENPFLF